ncbi:MAG TPA: S8 family serine peptidase, partial [Longimicrobium sp.]
MLEAPLAPVASRSGGEPDVRDRWIVVFNKTVADPRSTAARIVEERGGTLHFVYQYALRGFAATLSPTAADALRRDPRVAYVEADGLVQSAATQYSAPWGLDRIDQRYLGLDSYYSYMVTGSGVNVYVLDSGIRFSHSEFGGRAVLGTDV